MPQLTLQKDALARALTEVTLEVQRSRTVEEALSVAGAGLEAMGFDVAVVEVAAAVYGLRYLTRRPGLDELAAAVAEQLKAFHQLSSTALTSVMRTDQGVFLAELRQATSLWMQLMGVAEPVRALTESTVKGRAVVAPLHIRKEAWGGVIFMHDELDEGDLPLLNLFALQIGSALEVVAGLERLDRRNAELELVHALATASTRTDVNELCERALVTVCRSTSSDAGVLHRYEPETGAYVMVGNAFGYAGPLVDTYRRFTLPAGAPFAFQPVSLAIDELREGVEVVKAAGFRFATLVPLALEDQRVGMLCLFRRSTKAFADAEVRSAEILGLQMASLLERQRLFQESSRLYVDLKASYDELGRAQAEVVRHERLAALGELAAVMAHEVRNPLGVIFNSLTTLKRLIHPSGDAEMLLNMVGEEADRLNRIVADLLDFARPYVLVKKPIAVEAFISGAVDAATQTLPASTPVKVVTRFDRELPPFPVDAHLLRQALINLVVNGAQAMPRGGLVSVTARVEPRGGLPWLVIEVKDEGLGLTSRATEKIFQPFFTTKATGTGLGLAVVKRIVDSHGGEVSAQANPDKGTTFVVRLPGGTEREGLLTPPRPSPSAPRR